MTADKAKSLGMLAVSVICYAVMWWMLVNGLDTGVILGINKGGAQPVALVTQPGLYWFFVVFYAVIIAVVTLVTLWPVVEKLKKGTR
ncbi:hypothetical protein [Acidithiobacillus sp.]